MPGPKRRAAHRRPTGSVEHRIDRIGKFTQFIIGPIQVDPFREIGGRRGSGVIGDSSNWLQHLAGDEPAQRQHDRRHDQHGEDRLSPQLAKRQFLFGAADIDHRGRAGRAASGTFERPVDSLLIERLDQIPTDQPIGDAQEEETADDEKTAIDQSQLETDGWPVGHHAPPAKR